MASSDKTVTAELETPVAWLRLSRPETLNALDAQVLDELDAALDEVERDESIRVVVLTGAGRAFCAGADLKGVIDADGTIDGPALVRFVRRTSAVIERVASLSKPVIAAVNGLAVAGGFELVMACDLVIAASSAQLGDAHANYGLLPGAGGAARLARIAGPKVAKRLAFTGDFIAADELVASGLGNEVVADDSLEKRTTELALQIAEKSPVGLARMKRLINDAVDQPLAVSLAAEIEAIEAHVHSDDMREGLSAFREKRRPEFIGR